jgi:hypothetical protein
VPLIETAGGTAVLTAAVPILDLPQSFFGDSWFHEGSRRFQTKVWQQGGGV